MHPPLQNPKYASDVNMSNQTKWRNVGWKTSTFFIQSLQTFFYFCHVFTFLSFFIFSSGTFFFYIYGSISHSRDHCLPRLASLRRRRRRLIIRLDALAKALSVIATATWLGGWVAGWLAVTLRYCIKTAKRIRKLFRPSESAIILVFWYPCADTKFQGEPHQRGR